MEFAKKAGLPEMKHLLVPRTKGFYALTQQLRGKFDVIYSGTLCFDTYCIFSVDLNNGCSANRSHKNVK